MVDMSESTVKDKHVATPHGKKIVLTWGISMYRVIGLKQTSGINVYTLKAAKHFVGVAVNREE